MRIKGFVLLIVVSLILITFKTYAPKVNNVSHEEPYSLLYATSDEQESEVVFTYSPLSEGVMVNCLIIAMELL